MLGPGLTILQTTPTNFGPTGTVDVVVSYSNYRGVQCFDTPTLAFPPSEWRGRVLPARCPPWVITAYPPGTWLTLIIRATGAPPACAATYTTTQSVYVPALFTLRFAPDQSGATALAFQWGSVPFPRMYYRLLQGGVATVSQGYTDDPGVGILLDELTPETPYTLQVYGEYADGAVTGTIRANGVTAPPAALQPQCIVDAIVTDGDGSSTVILTYTAFYCATSLEVVYANQPEGWPGTVTVDLTDGVYVIAVTFVPDNTTLVLALLAQVSDTCLFPFPAAGDPLTTVLSVPVPTPGGACDAQVSGVTVTNIQPGCATISWTSPDGAPISILYQVVAGSTVAASGAVQPGTTTVSVSGLSPSTTYVVHVTCTCRDNGVGPASSSAPFTTLPSLVPSLSIQYGSITFTEDVATNTFTATVNGVDTTCLTNLQLALQPPVPVQGLVASGLNPSTYYRFTVTADPAPPGTCDSCRQISGSLSSSIVVPTPGICNGVPGVDIISLTCSTLTLLLSGPYVRFIIQFTEPTSFKSVVFGSPAVCVLEVEAEVYTAIEIYGGCTNNFLSNKFFLALTPPAVAAPSLPPPDVSKLTYTFADETASTILTYPAAALTTCVNTTDPDLNNLLAESPLIVTKLNAWQWLISNATPNTTYACSLQGYSSNAGCCVDAPIVLSTPFDLHVPAGPPPVPPPPPFTVVIPNYAGPPSHIKTQLVSGSLSTAQGDGPATQVGSYAWFVQTQTMFADKIVTGFVAYQTRRLISVNTHQFYLAIAIIYYGVTRDPASQGECVPIQPVLGGDYEATLSYSLASPWSNPETPPASFFARPPLVEFFLRLMAFNATAAVPVALGLTLYGSKFEGEQWWFQCAMDAGVDGMSVADPVDPRAVDSNITGFPNDGSTADGPPGAGWNTMERWFMYVGYVNQCLRQAIAGDEVAGVTLTSVTSENVQFFQISAITCDGEGNGFPNTQLPDTMTGAECNATIKALWSKWVNQEADLPDTSPDWWDPTAGAYLTPAQTTQAYAFTAGKLIIPCAVSATTPMWVKGMAVSDTGSPDYDAVDRILHEVYDTGSSPFRSLGAATGGARAFADTVPSFPTAATPYATQPELFPSQYGAWDNMITVGTGIPQTALWGVDPPCSVDGATAVVKLPAGLGSQTALTDAGVQVSPITGTGQYPPPWGNAAVSDYILGATTTGDAANRGWFLEGSRYDLYNGAWAAQVAASSGRPLSYAAVSQGSGLVDGAMLINDLSTGLKPFAAATAISCNSNQTAMAAQVYMLSTECGPFVNHRGVRACAAEGTTDQKDWQTFSVPNSALPATTSPWPGWPGWQGMAGQPYAPGVVGTLQRYAVDQMSFGEYDPNGDTVPSTGSTEDNFGVFADFDILVAAWLRLTLDLTGDPTSANAPNGISNAAAVQTTVPQMGCYELGYLPLSWFNPSET
jgi:hypothetical protein